MKDYRNAVADTDWFLEDPERRPLDQIIAALDKAIRSPPSQENAQERVLQMLNENPLFQQFKPIADIILSGYSGSEEALLNLLQKISQQQK